MSNNVSIKETKDYEMNIKVISPSKLVFIRLKRNKLAIIGLVVICVLVCLSIFAPFIVPYERDEVNLLEKYKAPSAEHLMGTDDLGRDVFTRLLYAGRISLSVGVVATFITIVIGIIIGSISGYYGGKIDAILMRLTDMFASLPFYIIAITVMALFGPSIYGTMVVMGCLWWTGTARLVRGQILSLREIEFMEAATALGISDMKKMFKFLLPNSIAPVIVSATLTIANAILTESALSYLGLGVQIPTPSWGNMLRLAQNMYILSNYWWIWIPPGLCIFITVMSFNFLGDGLRDAFDPKQGR